MLNPLKKKNTYLRRKSELLKDYLTVGIGFTLFGLFIYRKYKQINPPDPVDEPSYSREYAILDFVQDKLRKYMDYKSYEYKEIKEKKQAVDNSKQN